MPPHCSGNCETGYTALSTWGGNCFPSADEARNDLRGAREAVRERGGVARGSRGDVEVVGQDGVARGVVQREVPEGVPRGVRHLRAPVGVAPAADAQREEPGEGGRGGAVGREGAEGVRGGGVFVALGQGGEAEGGGDAPEVGGATVRGRRGGSCARGRERFQHRGGAVRRPDGQDVVAADEKG
ncbi:hypothetical protein C8J57DRAFT_1236451 [Mycena rebaudengoi]|nr:hypothetical protein C8J57DRAFT_1236451 [Mycena rebaudengoi]